MVSWGIVTQGGASLALGYRISPFQGVINDAD